jgi:hypothetical protein
VSHRGCRPGAVEPPTSRSKSQNKLCSSPVQGPGGRVTFMLVPITVEETQAKLLLLDARLKRHREALQRTARDIEWEELRLRILLELRRAESHRKHRTKASEPIQLVKAPVRIQEVG